MRARSSAVTSRATAARSHVPASSAASPTDEPPWLTLMDVAVWIRWYAMPTLDSIGPMVSEPRMFSLPSGRAELMA